MRGGGKGELRSSIVSELALCSGRGERGVADVDCVEGSTRVGSGESGIETGIEGEGVGEGEGDGE